MRSKHLETHEAQVRANTACRFVPRPTLDAVVGSNEASSLPSDGSMTRITNCD
jgi:hypothetical protein